MQEVWVRSLVRDLGSHHASWPENQNIKEKLYYNKFNKDLKQPTSKKPKKKKLKKKYLLDHMKSLRPCQTLKYHLKYHIKRRVG